MTFLKSNVTIIFVMMYLALYRNCISAKEFPSEVNDIGTNESILCKTSLSKCFGGNLSKEDMAEHAFEHLKRGMFNEKKVEDVAAKKEIKDPAAIQFLKKEAIAEPKIKVEYCNAYYESYEHYLLPDTIPSVTSFCLQKGDTILALEKMQIDAEEKTPKEGIKEESKGKTVNQEMKEKEIRKNENNKRLLDIKEKTIMECTSEIVSLGFEDIKDDVDKIVKFVFYEISECDSEKKFALEFLYDVTRRHNLKETMMESHQFCDKIANNIKEKAMVVVEKFNENIAKKIMQAKCTIDKMKIKHKKLGPKENHDKVSTAEQVQKKMSTKDDNYEGSTKQNPTNPNQENKFTKSEEHE